MTTSFTLIACCVINLCLISRLGLPHTMRALTGLLKDFNCAFKFLRTRMTEKREWAFQMRTLRLTRHLGITLVLFALLIAAYAPTMILAVYQNDLVDAFYSFEVLFGAIVALLINAMTGQKS